MKCVLAIVAAGILSACVSLDGPVGPAGQRITVEYDSKKSNVQEARKRAAGQCGNKGKHARLVADNPNYVVWSWGEMPAPTGGHQ